MTSLDTMEGGPHVIGWDDLDKRKLYVIAPAFSLAVRAILYPPMLIKTRLQVQNSPYKGTLDAFQQVVRHEGYRALYKGFTTNCIGLVVGQVYITSYEVSRKHAGKFGLNNAWRNFVAGAAASTVSQGLMVPIDVVTQLQMVQGQGTARNTGTVSSAKSTGSVTSAKSTSFSSGTLEQRRQLHTEPARKPTKLPAANPRLNAKPPQPSTAEPALNVKSSPSVVRSAPQIARSLYQTEGLRGLYRGYFASLCTYVPTSAIWWASYGICDGYTRSHPVLSSAPHLLLNAVSGGTAGIISSVATNPLDVVRTRLQVEGSRSSWKTIQTLWREDGPRWLARGVTARIMSAVPSGAVVITSYETVKWLCVRT